MADLRFRNIVNGESADAADAAFDAWGETTPTERQRALLRIADTPEEWPDELVRVESTDTGKPIAMTAGEELPPCVDQIRFFAGAARVLEGRGSAEYLKDHTSSISTTPFAELAQEFLPPGVFNVVCGDRDTGRALVEHPTPQMVSITGSVRAGIEVATSAATQVKRAHLELGGKAPVIVFDDADVEAAAEGIAAAGYFNAGQDCTAATRVLAGPGVHDDFVAALTEQARNTRTGAPDEDVLYGALNSQSQLDRVSGMVDRLPDHARIDAGGARQGDRGFFYSPTVVSGLRQDDEVTQDEIFGPVITVLRSSDEEEALRRANGVKHGPSSPVWTKDHGRVMRMAKRPDFGCVWINTHIPFVAEMPHGGFKQSGYGKDLSMYGLEDYTQIKHVMSYIGS
ncbi:MAG: aldehyde dehydrogenase family protein [Nocardioidaceae bacterium]